MSGSLQGLRHSCANIRPIHGIALPHTRGGVTAVRVRHGARADFRAVCRAARFRAIHAAGRIPLLSPVLGIQRDARLTYRAGGLFSRMPSGACLGPAFPGAMKFVPQSFRLAAEYRCAKLDVLPTSHALKYPILDMW